MEPENNVFVNNTLISGNNNTLLRIESGSNNIFYWNKFTPVGVYYLDGVEYIRAYVDDSNGSNIYDFLVAGVNQGNIWSNVLDGTINVIGNIPSGIDGLYVGTQGPGVPYNNITSGERLIGNVVDNAPLTPFNNINPPGAPPEGGTATVPGQVVITTAYRGTVVEGGRINLNWNAPYNGGSPITDYITEYKLTTSNTWINFAHTPSTTPSVTVTGINDTREYNFRVKAINAVGSGPYSSIFNTTMLPGQVASLSGTLGNNQVTLNWIAPSQGSSPITLYRIRYKQTSNTNWTSAYSADANTTSTIISNLTNGVSYDFKVRAWNSLGAGLFSTAITKTPAAIVVPGQVVVTSMNRGNVIGGGLVTLSWNAPSNGSLPITDYIIDYKLTTSNTWINFPHAPSTTPTVTITGLTDNLHYDFRVKAISAAGSGPYSTTVSTTSIPGQIVGLTGTPGNNQVSLSWTPTTNGSTPITLYRIRYKQTSNTNWTSAYSADANTTSTIISNLTNGVSYDFKVRAWNSLGAGLFSTAITIIVTAPNGTPCPGTPTVTYGGQTYNTVQIGTQCWLKQNLNVGTMINSGVAQANNNVVEKYCYNNTAANCNIYGGLYQWNELMQYTTTPGSQGICPAGWHVPTNAEFTVLSNFLGGDVVSAGKLKEVGFAHWQTPNVGATDGVGFTALPGGYYEGIFSSMNRNAQLYTSTQDASSNVYYRAFSYSAGNLGTLVNYKTTAASVRCIKSDNVQLYANVSITVSANPIPSGTSVTFTATPVNGGTNPTYQWKKNGAAITGATSVTYSYVPTNGDVITVVMTSNLPGVLGSPATSNAITMIVTTPTGTPCPGTPTVTYGGQTYDTVQIGTQCWLKQNLNVGTKIANTVTQTNNGIIEKYCYNNNDSNCGIYGGLYQWNELMQYTTTPGTQGICPAGWHVPTIVEYTVLSTYMGGENVAGGKLKEIGFAHWQTPNTGATNDAGFTALPSGYNAVSGGFGGINRYGQFYTSVQSTATDAWLRTFSYSAANTYSLLNFKTTAGAVRCIMN